MTAVFFISDTISNAASHKIILTRLQSSNTAMVFSLRLGYSARNEKQLLQ
jgi:hypothetical protein